MENLRVRASSLFSTSPFRSRTATPDPTAQDSARNGDNFDPSLLEKGRQDSAQGTRARPQLAPLNVGSVDESQRVLTPSKISGQKTVRVLPTWVRDAEEDDDEEADAHTNLLLRSPRCPPEAQVAHHNHTPTFLLKSKPEPGRLHDAVRESVPPTPRYHISEIASRWRQFAEWSAYPGDTEEKGERVTEEWLVAHGPDYFQPWRAAEDNGQESHGLGMKAQRKVWWRRFQRTLLRNPVIPLIFRLLVMVFSAIALGLGANITKNLGVYYPKCSKTSPLMAIGVDAVAIVYLVMITYDEYRGQPLGLRSAKTKVRLIMFDLFFIVFDSANLSLAFEGLGPFSSTCSVNQDVTDKQIALASVLLVALLAWLITFAISILRVVERVQQ